MQRVSQVVKLLARRAAPGLACLVLLPVQSRPASAAAAGAAFVMPDPASPLYRSFIAVAGEDLQAGENCRLSGNLHSNNDLELGAKSVVTGNVSARGQVESHGTVTGTVTSGAPARALPALPSEAQARALANRVFTKDTTFKNAVIDDVVYVAGGVRIEGSLNGKGTIIARRDLELTDAGDGQHQGGGNQGDEGRSAVTLDPATRLSLLSFASIHVGQSRALRGLLFAAQDVELAEKTTFTGAIVARHQVQIGQGSQLAFLELDITAPVISGLVPANGSLLASAAPAIRAAFADDLSGVDPASVRFLFDGADRTGKAQVTAAGLGFTPPAPLADGGHTAAVSVRDVAGNLAQAAWSFTTDVTPPSLAITAPAALVATPSPALAVSYGDATSGVDPTSLHIVLDGADLTATCLVAAAAATCTAPPLAAGTHRLAASLRDRAGNSAAVTENFAVETGPVISFVTPADGGLAPAQPRISALFSGQGSPIDPKSFRLTLDGADQSAAAQVWAASFSFVPASPLSEGPHTASVQIGDQAGVKSQAQTRFFVDAVPPDLRIAAPEADKNGSLSMITVSYSDSNSGVDLSTLQIRLDDKDLAPGCTVQANRATCVPPPQAEGLHVAAAMVKDRAGNAAAANLVFGVVLAAPTVTITSPADGASVSSAALQVSGAVTGPSAISRLTVKGSPAAFSAGQFHAVVTLSEGYNFVQVIADDSTGKEGTAAVAVFLSTRPPSLLIDPPSPRLTNQPVVRVTGQVSSPSGIRSVTANGVAALLQASSFAADVPVPDGQSSVTVQAVDQAGNSASASLEVHRFSLPVVSITAPADLSLLAATTVTVSGTVSDPAAPVTVNGIPAQLSGTGFIASDVPLLEGGNIITATARSPTGLIGTSSIDVVRDLTPPRLSIDHPVDGAVEFESTVTVSGLVNDIVPGTVNAHDVTVTVNGIQAMVANRSFLVPSLPLSPGDNVLTAVAVDAAGNKGAAVIKVRLVQPTAPRLAVVSGDHQQASIGSPLAQPLVVALLDATGSPIAGKTVLFRVRGGSGTLDGGKRGFAVATDAAGKAQAHFVLGKRSGAASQVVEASSPGAAGPATFIASAVAGPPAFLVVDAGDQQVGIAGQELPRPLVAVVTDRGFNRVEGVPVTFTVVKGRGHFANGQRTIAVVSDSDGRAIVKPTLDTAEGVANNVVRASVATSSGTAQAAFTASGRVAGDPAGTSVSGLVLDNANQPVAGVTLRILDTLLTGQTDASGLFRIGGVPVGTVKLVVDPSTVNRAGPWPGLEFTLTTIPGRDNTLNMPIYLVPLDVRQGLPVDETHGGQLTLPDLPGFALDIAPGSVTFAGGGHSGVVSVTLVHNDKVPMVPNFGQQPLLIVTIQPAGARFEPPARLTLPNVEGLSAGEVTEMYSFDHDLGHFVSIGPATVSDDGAVIVSNPGVGIVKAGWHCSGFPALVGAFDLCPRCQRCDGLLCEPLTGDLCQLDSPGKCDAYGACFQGACLPVPVRVDRIIGPSCTAAVNAPVSFSAESNAPDRLQWQGNPDGVPPTGAGGSYTVSFPAAGVKNVVAECIPASRSISLDVRQSCDSRTPPTTWSSYREGCTVPANAWGLTALAALRPTATTCARGDQLCLFLESLAIGHLFCVGGPGAIDVTGPDDPGITAANCQAIIEDLTPTRPGTGPPRTRWWSSRITTDHEKVHEDQLRLDFEPGLFNDTLTLVDHTCQRCQAPDLHSLDNQLRALVQRYQGLVDQQRNALELEAHGRSNDEYRALIAGIRARALASGWRRECQ